MGRNSQFYLDQVANPVKKEEEGVAGSNKPASMFQMMNHIQSLISMAVENAKQEEKSISHQKSEAISFSFLSPSHSHNKQSIINNGSGNCLEFGNAIQPIHQCTPT